MQKEFKHLINQVKAVLKTEIDKYESKKYLIALSGGSDSVLLFHVFKHLNLHFSAAHINYSLRDKESDADERFVKTLCKENDIPLYCLKVDTLEKQKKGQSIQMVARNIRYNYFDEVMQQHQLDYLVLGHHANDQVETVLLNLFRGCGLNGLTGMQLVDGKKLRPILTVEKKELLKVLETEKINYRNDSSNQKNEYKRNYLRNDLIPLIEERWPGFMSTMLNNITHFQAEKKAIDTNSKSNIYVDFTNGINIDVLELKNDEAQKNALQKALVKVGFNSTELTKLLQEKSNNETKQLRTGEYLLERKNNQLLISPVKEKITPQLKIKNKVVEITGLDNTFVLSLEEKINAESIKGQLSITPWQAGERMIPLGMKGSKKISDLLTELKMSKNQKSNVYVLRDEEKPLWLIGFRIDNRVKIKSDKAPSSCLHLKII